jgi:dipeptidyl aminopeptidase/acylaminoacyl peptidase
VIAANFRGSTSFGKEFQNANFQDLGGGDTEDAVAAADFAITSGYADPTKLVVMGHSYGGFLTIKAMQNFPTKWAAGVAQMPLVNMANAAKASPFLRGLLGEVTTKEEVNSYSPLSSMPKLQAPLLVQIGEQDTVCTPADAKQMQQNSKRVKIHLFADEEHSLVQEKNKVESLKQIAEFLKQKMP